MAVTTSKVTYSLKPETVDRVQELATAWGVPKSEVISRAVHDLKDNDSGAMKLTPLQALKELHFHAGLTKAQARKMNEEVSFSASRIRPETWMIHLDTNYLIAVATLGNPEGRRAERWLEDGEKLCVSSVVWTEFLSSTATSNQIRLISALVHRVVPFGQTEAELAAALYNFAGRKRNKRLDTMIAATAITARAALATLNLKDFSQFKLRGLLLV